MTSRQRDNFQDQLKLICDELKDYCYTLMAVIRLLRSSDEATLVVELSETLKEFPQFEVLKPQENWIKAVLRRICSREISIERAIKALEESQKNTIKLVKCFNQKELYNLP